MHIGKAVLSRIKKYYYRLGFAFWARQDKKQDLRRFGTSLAEYVPSIFRNEEADTGYTGSESTHYCILEMTAEALRLGENDRFLDVGCGKGRVLGFFAQAFPQAEICGAEINPEVYEFASRWSRDIPNIRLLNQNVFELDLSEYTVLWLYHPFLPKTAESFWETAEKTLSPGTRVVLWNDYASMRFLKNREGWKVLKKINKGKNRKYGIPYSYPFNGLYLLQYR